MIYVFYLIIMFTIYTDNNATECPTAAAANAVISSWLAADAGITVCVELNDTDNNPVSYWEFTSGDALLSDNINP